MQISEEGPKGPLESGKMSAMQIGVIAICGLITMLDGFDTQAMGYVVPRLSAEWGIKPGNFAGALSAGLFGLMVGNLGIGPLADKFGRKVIIVLATTFFGLLTLATALATDLNHLLILRFLTGIGLGAVLPNTIALTGEYAPARLRATAIMVMFAGLPLGSTIGGLIAAPLMKAYGWQSVFIMGGIVPLLLAPLLIFILPESVTFLAVRGASEDKIGKILHRINPTASVKDFIASVQAEKAKAPRGFTVPQLFKEGRTASTLLLWVTFFMSLLVYYFLVSWLPTLVRQSGLPEALAIYATAILNLGGVVGALVLSRLLDRYNPFITLGLTYVAAAVFVALVAFGTVNVPVLMVAAALAGFCAAGAQIGSNALAAGIYPTAIRATGVGWALGVGRIGAIVGPLVAGALLNDGWIPRNIILTACVPALIGAVAVFLLGGARKRALA